jgi:hypothetical protein
MNCKYLALSSSLAFFSLSCYANNFYIDFDFGAGLAKIGKTQDYSPVHDLINRYTVKKKFKLVSPMLGLGVGYQFDFTKNTTLLLGIEGLYIDYGEINGTLKPAINIKPNFDTLTYSFSAESSILLLKGKLRFNNFNWLPYIALGSGISFNNLGDFSKGTDNTSAPYQNTYKRKIKGDVAYSIGVGIYQHELQPGINLSIGYRFIYSGHGALENPISGQDSLQSGPLMAQFIVFSLQLN